MAVAFVTWHVSCLSALQPSLTHSTNASQLQHVNSAACQRIDPGAVIVEIHQGEDAAVDELWSVLEKTSQHRGLWQAIDHRMGVVSASGWGPQQDDVFCQLNAWLAPCGMRHVYTDGAEVSHRDLGPEPHTVGKTQTQKMERKHLTFRSRRKRLMRKTSRVSHPMRLHDIVIGLLVNRDEFGMVV
jgi:insertion element IS1 protein InsB